MFDVNPYYYQILSSALDYKIGNEFSVVLFYYIAYSIKFLLADAILTSY